MAPKFVIPLSSATVVEGKKAVFDLKVRAKPNPTLRWFKDGIPLDEDVRIKFEDMSDGRWRMTIFEVLTSDAGKYSCEAMNSAGKDLCEATLRIQRKTMYRVAHVKFPI